MTVKQTLRGKGYSRYGHFGMMLQAAIILFLIFDWMT